MRKVVASELVSLERWSIPIHNDEMAEANASGMAAADAMLNTSRCAGHAHAVSVSFQTHVHSHGLYER